MVEIEQQKRKKKRKERAANLQRVVTLAIGIKIVSQMHVGRSRQKAGRGAALLFHTVRGLRRILRIGSKSWADSSHARIQALGAGWDLDIEECALWF